MRLLQVEMARLHARPAATMRGRHFHALAAPFHKAATGMLFHCHRDTRDGTRHGGREKRDKDCQNDRDVA
jgi:hypothetical protein